MRTSSFWQAEACFWAGVRVAPAGDTREPPWLAPGVDEGGSAVWDALAAESVWAPAVVRPSTPPNPTVTRTAVGSTKRFCRRRRSTVLFEEEETAVQADPDDVDEVPVVTDPLEDGEFTGVAGRPLHPAQQEDHGHQPQGDVEAVEAAHDVEERAVGVGPRAGQLGRPLVGLVGQERHPQKEGGRHPDAGPPPVVALLVEDRL